MKKILLFSSVFLFAIILGTGVAVKLTDSSEFCGSCHTMDVHYKTWFHSSHRADTNCSSCHVPKGLIKKPLYKAKSGLYDAYVFYIKGPPAKIDLKEDSKKIIQDNCISCHGGLVREINKGDGENCYHCHTTPHGPVKNLVF